MLEKDIKIPDSLCQTVEESLAQVGKIHRRRILRKTTAICGSFLIVATTFTVFGMANPALASQIPLIGGLFTQLANHNKISVGNENVGTYDVIEPIHATEQSADSKLTIAEGYCDGNKLQLVLQLDTPEAYLEQYGEIRADKNVVLTINGENTPFSPLLFSQKESGWNAFLEAVLPESLQSAESLNVSFKLDGMVAQEKPKANEQYSEDHPIPTATLAETFDSNFTVTVNKEKNFGFACEAEANGVELSKVTGTPIETVFTVEKPYWGPVSAAPEDGSKGFPSLMTEDGTEVRFLSGESMSRGGYDYAAEDVQTADLYFDGVPLGTKQLILRFYETSQQKTTLAEFTVDLEAQTVSVTDTADQDGPLHAQNPERYHVLQGSGTPPAETGPYLTNVSINQNDSTSSVNILVASPEKFELDHFRIEMWNSVGTLLFSSEHEGAGDPEGVFEKGFHISKLSEAMEAVNDQTLWVYGDMEAVRVPQGETVTVKLTDLSSGEVLLNQDLLLDMVQR